MLCEVLTLAIFWILEDRRGRIKFGYHRLNEGFYRLGANLSIS